MKKIKKIMHQFCSFQNQNKSSYFKNIDLLKKTIEKQHFFVRKHHKQLGVQISTLFRNHEWGLLKKGLRCINIGQMDSWLTLRKIGKSLSQTLRNVVLKQMNQLEIQDMLFTLVELNYEPIPQHNQQKGQKSELVYDNIQGFIKQLTDYTKQIQITQKIEHYLQLVRKLLHTNPQLFLEKKKYIENYILNNFQRLSERRLLLNEIVAKGIISDFWGNEFKQNLMTKRVKENNMTLFKSLYLNDLRIPTKIENSKLKQKIKTESEIVNILSSLNYNIKANVMINEYEVDVLINDSVIVEYNGHHHYVINSQALVPTLRDKWRTNILKERGFITFIISYDQWKKLKLFQEKRQFLVTNVENAVMKHYGYNK